MWWESVRECRLSFCKAIRCQQSSLTPFQRVQGPLWASMVLRESLQCSRARANLRALYEAATFMLVNLYGEQHKDLSCPCNHISYREWIGWSRVLASIWVMKVRHGM